MQKQLYLFRNTLCIDYATVFDKVWHKNLLELKENLIYIGKIVEKSITFTGKTTCMQTEKKLCEYAKIE